jgi:hypothetical protein
VGDVIETLSEDTCNVIAGPALAAAACPVSTKMPAPIMAPTPSETRLTALSVRLSGTPSWVVKAWTSGSPASASRAASDFRAQTLAMATVLSATIPPP